MEEKTDKNQSILDTLYSNVFDLDELPTLEQAKEEIAEHDLNSDKLCKWAEEQIKQLNGKKLLAQARSARLNQVKSLQLLEENSTTKSIEETTIWLVAKLKQLASNNISQAQVYCRRFEEATDEDLFQLEADLRMLESTSDNETE